MHMHISSTNQPAADRIHIVRVDARRCVGRNIRMIVCPPQIAYWGSSPLGSLIGIPPRPIAHIARPIVDCFGEELIATYRGKGAYGEVYDLIERKTQKRSIAKVFYSNGVHMSTIRSEAHSLINFGTPYHENIVEFYGNT